MAIVKLPINMPVNETVSEASLTQQSPYLMNGFLTEVGSTQKRPGLEEFVDLTGSSGVYGLYWWPEADTVIALVDRKIYRVNEDGNFYESPALPQAGFFTTPFQPATSQRTSFATDGTTLSVANGGKLFVTEKIDWINDPTYADFPTFAPANSPSNATYVAAMNQYTLANNLGEAAVNFSDVGDATTWAALDFFTAELRGDNVTAIFATVWNELYVFGNNSLEIWYDDGTTPWRPFSGAHSIRGTISPATIALTDNEFYYLDTSRRVVKLVNREVADISQPINGVLQGLSTFEDAIADYMDIGGYSFYVISFPTEEVTFAYNATLDTWSRWGYWNSTTGTHEHWLGRSHCFADKWGAHLVGDRRNGKIYKLSFDSYDDAGSVMRVIRRTGHIDHGTSNKKRNRYVNFKFRKGDGIPSGDEPYVVVRWRDDDKAGWRNERQIPLGKIGDTEFIHRMSRTGIYRTRQYEILMSENSPYTLVGAEEDFEVLSR
jgi:hypothetical protein